MIKDGTRPGSSYAARDADRRSRRTACNADFDADRHGQRGSGTRWLRLVRAGNTITGYESADGATWQKIGTADAEDLPSDRARSASSSRRRAAVLHVAGRRQFIGR